MRGIALLALVVAVAVPLALPAAVTTAGPPAQESPEWARPRPSAEWARLGTAGPDHRAGRPTRCSSPRGVEKCAVSTSARENSMRAGAPGV